MMGGFGLDRHVLAEWRAHVNLQWSCRFHIKWENSWVSVTMNLQRIAV